MVIYGNITIITVLLPRFLHMRLFVFCVCVLLYIISLQNNTVISNS